MAVASTLMLTLGLGGTALLLGTREDSHGAVAGYAAMTDEAATFAISSAAKAGLVDPSGYFLEYKEIEETESGWIAYFDKSQCSTTIGTCESISGEVGLHVQKQGDEFLISDATELDAERRDRVVGYRGPVSGLPVNWMVAYAVVGGPHKDRIEGSPIWGGSIPASSAGATCRAEVVDSGRKVWKSVAFELSAPTREEERSGSILSFPKMPSGLAGQATITCTSFEGRGWRPTADTEQQAINSSPSPNHAPIRIDLVWSDEAFTPAYTRCTATVFGKEGKYLGDERVYLAGPDEDLEGPPFHTQRLALVAVDDSSLAETAHVSCTLVGSEEFERGGN